jgi:hypothetical protein
MKLTRENVAAEVQAENKKSYHDGEKKGASSVKVLQRCPDAALVVVLAAEVCGYGEDGYKGAEGEEGQLDAELPTPAQALCHGAAECSTEGGADADNDVDDGLVRAATSRKTC